MKKFFIVLFALAIFTINLISLPELSLAIDYTWTPIDFPGAESTSARGINNSGDIVGHYSYLSGLNQGFLYSGGSYSTISVPDLSLLSRVISMI